MRHDLARLAPLRAPVLVPRRDIDLSAFVELQQGYAPANPSILRVEDGYLVALRSVNYRYIDSRRVEFSHGNTFLTRNHFFLLNDDLTLRSQLEGLSEQFRDVEDVRLFRLNGEICASGTRPGVDEEGRQTSTMVLLRFSPDLLKGEECELPSPYSYPREKNWAPYSFGRDLAFIYSFDPPLKLTFDQHLRGSVSTIGRNDRVDDPPSFFLDCGSSAVVPAGEAPLVVAHRRQRALPFLATRYVNRLFKVVEGNLVAGRHFFIGERTSQFVNGLVWDEQSTIMTYGVLDREARLAVFDSAALLRATF